jgi:hypothetical protein
MIEEIIFHALFWGLLAVFLQWMQTTKTERFHEVEGGAIKRVEGGYIAFIDDGSDLIPLQRGRVLRTKYAALRSIEAYNGK